MKAVEFISEDTDAGSIAVVVAPLGAVQRRVPVEAHFDKYKKTKKKRVSKNEHRS
jgi:hypothetical protein